MDSLFNEVRLVKDRKGETKLVKPATVYYSSIIDADHVTDIYSRLNKEIFGKIAIKLHTGEKHGPYILPRPLVKEFMEDSGLIDHATIVETNTAYAGDRYTTEDHRETLKVNGWNFCPVDILDEHEDTMYLDTMYPKARFDRLALGGHLRNYDSMIVLTHFKGHTMGGYGGSLKNIAIGCATGHEGKYTVHGYTGPRKPPQGDDWDNYSASKDEFMERLADSGKVICDYFGSHIIFINFLMNMSVDCDCAGTSAEAPTIPDLGIVASTDIVAVDKASLDLVMQQPHDIRQHLEERIRSRHGFTQIDAMIERNMGNPNYKLIDIDKVPADPNWNTEYDGVLPRLQDQIGDGYIPWN